MNEMLSDMLRMVDDAMREGAHSDQLQWRFNAEGFTRAKMQADGQGSYLVDIASDTVLGLPFVVVHQNELYKLEVMK